MGSEDRWRLLLGMGCQTRYYWGRDVVRQPLVVWYPMGVREELVKECLGFGGIFFCWFVGWEEANTDDSRTIADDTLRLKRHPIS